MSQQYLLPQPLKIIFGTSVWFQFVFGYLVFIGIRAAGARIAYTTKLFIIPLILSKLKRTVFMARSLICCLLKFKIEKT